MSKVRKAPLLTRRRGRGMTGRAGDYDARHQGYS
jgi:hypothetical protein